MHNAIVGTLERRQDARPIRSGGGAIGTRSDDDRRFGTTGRDSDRVSSGAYLDRGTGIEFEMESAWVRRQLPPTARIIVDVGCGNGRLLNSLPPADLYGFDQSVAGLIRARDRNGQVNFACARADQLPLVDQSVDAVIAQHLIEHLPDPAATIREWRRVLRPGGVLLVLTPNASFVDPSIFGDPTHVGLFRADDLRDAMAREGFCVADLRTLGLSWFRNYARYPGAWRLRRFVIAHADRLSAATTFRLRGQTLCCAALRGDSP